MARDIESISQINLWGKQADSFGLEPQRTDLFFVDFVSAIRGVGAAANVKLVDVIPQYVRSVTLPELRTKAEPIRRDSVPYNVPSWDDPLDPVKLVFMWDTHDQNERSDVIQFLDAWLALTRAGRGARYQGYTTNRGHLLLNNDYRVDFQFDINLYLLRGGDANAGGFNNDGSDNTAFKEFTARANAAYRTFQSRQSSIQQGAQKFSEQPTSFEEAVTYEQLGSDPLEQNMVLHTIYLLHQAWLGAYKIADLSYTESTLLTVEATFYVDSIDLSTPSAISGQAQRTP